MLWLPKCEPPPQYLDSLEAERLAITGPSTVGSILAEDGTKSSDGTPQVSILSGREIHDYLSRDMPNEAEWMKSISEYGGHYYGHLGGHGPNKGIPIDEVQAYARTPHPAGACVGYNPLLAPRWDSVMDFVDTVAAACSNPMSEFRLADMSIKFRLSIAQSIHHMEPGDFVVVKNAANPPSWLIEQSSKPLVAMYHSTMASTVPSICQHGPGPSFGAGAASLELCFGTPVKGFYATPDLQKALFKYPAFYIKVGSEYYPTWELTIWDGTLPLRAIVRGLVRDGSHLWKRQDKDGTKQYLMRPDQFYMTHIIFIAGRPEHVHRSISGLVPVWGRLTSDDQHLSDLQEELTSRIPAEISYCHNINPGVKARRFMDRQRVSKGSGSILAEGTGANPLPVCEPHERAFLCMTYVEVQPENEFTDYAWFARKRLIEDRRLERPPVVHLGYVLYDEKRRVSKKLFLNDGTFNTSVLDARPDLMKHHWRLPEGYSPCIDSTAVGGVQNVMHIFTLASEGKEHREKAFEAARERIITLCGTLRDRVEAQSSLSMFDAAQAKLLQTSMAPPPAVAGAVPHALSTTTSKSKAKPKPPAEAGKPTAASLKRKAKADARQAAGEDVRVDREFENYTKRFRECALAIKVMPQLSMFHMPRLSQFPMGGVRINSETRYPIAELTETVKVNRDPDDLEQVDWIKEIALDNVQVQLVEQRLSSFRPVEELMKKSAMDDTHDTSGLRLGGVRRDSRSGDYLSSSSGSILAETRLSEEKPERRMHTRFIRAGMVAQTIKPTTEDLPPAPASTGAMGTRVPGAGPDVRDVWKLLLPVDEDKVLDSETSSAATIVPTGIDIDAADMDHEPPAATEGKTTPMDTGSGSILAERTGGLEIVRSFLSHQSAPRESGIVKTVHDIMRKSSSESILAEAAGSAVDVGRPSAERNLVLESEHAWVMAFWGPDHPVVCPVATHPKCALQARNEEKIRLARIARHERYKAYLEWLEENGLPPPPDHNRRRERFIANRDVPTDDAIDAMIKAVGKFGWITQDTVAGRAFRHKQLVKQKKDQLKGTTDDTPMTDSERSAMAAGIEIDRQQKRYVSLGTAETDCLTSTTVGVNDVRPSVDNPSFRSVSVYCMAGGVPSLKWGNGADREIHPDDAPDPNAVDKNPEWTEVTASSQHRTTISKSDFASMISSKRCTMQLSAMMTSGIRENQWSMATPGAGSAAHPDAPPDRATLHCTMGLRLLLNAAVQADQNESVQEQILRAEADMFELAQANLPLRPDLCRWSSGATKLATQMIKDQRAIADKTNDKRMFEVPLEIQEYHRLCTGEDFDGIDDRKLYPEAYELANKPISKLFEDPLFDTLYSSENYQETCEKLQKLDAKWWEEFTQGKPDDPSSVHSQRLNLIKAELHARSNYVDAERLEFMRTTTAKQMERRFIKAADLTVMKDDDMKGTEATATSPEIASSFITAATAAPATRVSGQASGSGSILAEAPTLPDYCACAPAARELLTLEWVKEYSHFVTAKEEKLLPPSNKQKKHVGSCGMWIFVLDPLSGILYAFVHRRWKSSDDSMKISSPGGIVPRVACIVDQASMRMSFRHGCWKQCREELLEESGMGFTEESWAMLSQTSFILPTYAGCYYGATRHINYGTILSKYYKSYGPGPQWKHEVTEYGMHGLGKNCQDLFGDYTDIYHAYVPVDQLLARSDLSLNARIPLAYMATAAANLKAVGLRVCSVDLEQLLPPWYSVGHTGSILAEGVVPTRVSMSQSSTSYDRDETMSPNPVDPDHFLWRLTDWKVPKWYLNTTWDLYAKCRCTEQGLITFLEIFVLSGLLDGSSYTVSRPADLQEVDDRSTTSVWGPPTEEYLNRHTGTSQPTRTIRIKVKSANPSGRTVAPGWEDISVFHSTHCRNLVRILSQGYLSASSDTKHHECTDPALYALQVLQSALEWGNGVRIYTESHPGSGTIPWSTGPWKVNVMSETIEKDERYDDYKRTIDMCDNEKVPYVHFVLEGRAAKEPTKHRSWGEGRGEGAMERQVLFADGEDFILEYLVVVIGYPFHTGSRAGHYRLRPDKSLGRPNATLLELQRELNRPAKAFKEFHEMNDTLALLEPMEAPRAPRKHDHKDIRT